MRMPRLAAYYLDPGARVPVKEQLRAGALRGYQDMTTKPALARFPGAHPATWRRGTRTRCAVTTGRGVGTCQERRREQ